MCIAGQVMDLSQQFNPLKKKVDQDSGASSQLGLQPLGIPATKIAAPIQPIGTSIAARKASGG